MTVSVGIAGERFVVHEHLLTYYSEFFRVALHRKPEKGDDKVDDKMIKLEDADANLFELFVFWLYHQRFPQKNNDDDDEFVEMWSPEAKSLDNLIFLYLFAHEYNVPKLKADTTATLYSIYERNPERAFPAKSVIDAVFRALPEDMPMRRLLIDIYACYVTPTKVNYLQDVSCLPFLRGLCHRYATHWDSPFKNNMNGYRNYHEQANRAEERLCPKRR